MIGTIVTATVDRPLGSYHPDYKDTTMDISRVLLHLMVKNRMFTF